VAAADARHGQAEVPIRRSTTSSTTPVEDPSSTASPSTSSTSAPDGTHPAREGRAGADAPATARPGTVDPGPAPTAPTGSVHEVLPGTGGPPPASPTDPIGELDDDGPVPAGLGFTAPPQPQGGSPAIVGGPGGLAVAPSCSHQCITRGVAYPRGFGAELVVETSVPAELFLSVVADLDDDGDYEWSEFDWSDPGVTEHTWALDHLEPGTTYHAMVAATDGDGHTAHAWGQFTTLSQRDVIVELGGLDVTSGPGNISSTRWKLGLDGPVTDVTPGNQGILLYPDLPRHVDVDFWVLRSWDADICQVWTTEGAAPQGHSEPACLAWNSTSLDDVDLDTIPAGQSHWTQTSVQVSLHSPTGGGGALPPGYGDPYWFAFEVPMTLHVSYS
jgi:hypothetical protein